MKESVYYIRLVPDGNRNNVPLHYWHFLCISMFCISVVCFESAPLPDSILLLQPLLCTLTFFPD